MDLRPYRLHLIGAALALLSLLIILVYLGFGAAPGPKKQSLGAAIRADFAPLPLPADALFIPAEPEIIPKIILSREKRSSWSASDAVPFWTNPRMIDQAPLNTAAEKSIRLMFESVR